MMAIDEIHRRVEESDNDQVRTRRSPDFSAATRGDDPIEVYPKLGEVVQEVIEHFRRAGGKVPDRQKLPVMDVS